jgi:hypothetical protein
MSGLRVQVRSTADDICLAEDCQSCQPIEQKMQRMTEILDAKCMKANLEQMAKSSITPGTSKEMGRMFRRHILHCHWRAVQHETEGQRRATSCLTLFPAKKAQAATSPVLAKKVQAEILLF